MIVHYINLDEAVERRNAIEANFAATLPIHLPWHLKRFAAISAQDNQVKTFEGWPSDQEKACLLSHYSLLMQVCASGDYHWIVEDDIHFSKRTFDVVATYLELHKEIDWDILFTELTVRSAPFMLELFAQRQSTTDGEIKTLNLEHIPFASAGSYIVNPKSKDKIMAMLMTHDLRNSIWDLFLSDCVSSKKLKAFVTIPFVTELSAHSINSQIVTNQTNSTDLLLYAFRNLMGFSINVDAAEQCLDKIDSAYFDKQSSCFGRIMSGMLTQNFLKK